MLAEAKNTELYAEWLERIRDPETRDAFLFIVGLASALPGYRCHPQYKGEVRDFRFFRDDEQPFAFIPTQNWLLFYFRLPAIRSGKCPRSLLEQEFDAVGENAAGEWTIKLRNIGDVKRLWRLLGELP